MSSDSSLRFQGEEGHHLELRLLSTPDDPSGDLLVLATVETSGFRGAIDCWIQREAWESFATDLARLEETRQGRAAVAAISPGELEIEVRSTDRAGHVAIGGLLGTRTSGSVVVLEFSPIAFDPSTLADCVRIARAWTGATS